MYLKDGVRRQDAHDDMLCDMVAAISAKEDPKRLDRLGPTHRRSLQRACPEKTVLSLAHDLRRWKRLATVGRVGRRANVEQVGAGGAMLTGLARLAGRIPRGRGGCRGCLRLRRRRRFGQPWTPRGCELQACIGISPITCRSAVFENASSRIPEKSGVSRNPTAAAPSEFSRIRLLPVERLAFADGRRPDRLYQDTDRDDVRRSSAWSGIPSRRMPAGLGSSQRNLPCVRELHPFSGWTLIGL